MRPAHRGPERANLMQVGARELQDGDAAQARAALPEHVQRGQVRDPSFTLAVGFGWAAPRQLRSPLVQVGSPSHLASPGTDCYAFINPQCRRFLCQTSRP
jgi:hypothetical protein